MRTLLLVTALAVAIVLLAGYVAQPSAAVAPVETAQVSMPPSYRFDPLKQDLRHQKAQGIASIPDWPGEDSGSLMRYFANWYVEK